MRTQSQTARKSKNANRLRGVRPEPKAAPVVEDATPLDGEILTANDAGGVEAQVETVTLTTDDAGTLVLADNGLQVDGHTVSAGDPLTPAEGPKDPDGKEPDQQDQPGPSDQQDQDELTDPNDAGPVHDAGGLSQQDQEALGLKSEGAAPTEQPVAVIVPLVVKRNSRIAPLQTKVVDLLKTGAQTVAAMSEKFGVTERDIRLAIDRARTKGEPIKRVAVKTFGYDAPKPVVMQMPAEAVAPSPSA